jgi:ABC-2 type transport system permease protein
MRKLLQVAWFEFRTMAATKGFVISTIVGPLLIFAMAVLPSLLATQSGDRLPQGDRIGIVGGDQEIRRALASAIESRGLVPLTDRSREELERLVQNETARGFIVVPDAYRNAERFHYVARSSADPAVAGFLEETIGEYLVRARLERVGVTPDRVAELTRRPELVPQRLGKSGETEEQNLMGVFFTMLGMVMLIYMTILLYGQMIGRSALQEKQSKTVEILLSSVRPLDLMFGKILGKGTAGLLQYLFWIGVALVLISVLGADSALQIPATLTLGNLGFLLLFFLLAYFLYAAAYAALGSVAQDEQHLGQLGMPLILMLIVPLVLMSLILSAPGSPVIVALSFFPFTAPIVLFARILIAAPPLWHVLLSVGIMLVTILLVALASAKLFRTAILMTGQRVTFSALARMLRSG